MTTLSPAQTFSTTGNFTPAFSNSTPVVNNTSVDPTQNQSILEEIAADIAANDITSKANNVYSFLAACSLVAACFLLYSFIQTYRAQRRLAWLDCLLCAFCGTQLLLLFLSLHSVAYRPDYLNATGLGCATLSFAINAVSLCGLLILVLMAYVLTLDPPSHGLLRKPAVCAALVIVTSVLISLLLAGIRGPRDGLQELSICFMDSSVPVSSVPVSSLPDRSVPDWSVPLSYAAARLCLALLIPYILQLGLLICGCIRQFRSNGRFLSGSEDGPVFLTVTAVVFFCHLFYSVALVRGGQLAKDGPRVFERAFLSVAEFVLFSGSSASLLLVLFMHKPSRENLQGAYRQLRDCCRNPGHTQPNRNIIAPHIEITDTLQDIES